MKTKEVTKDNDTLARELKELARDWVEKFNYIQIDVLEAVAEREGSSVIEHIRSEKITFEDIADHNGHYGDKRYINKLKKEYSDVEDHPDYEAIKEDREQNNYPMWNTCFEFKEKESEEVIEAAIEAGCGVIEGLGDFNQILFFSGCGYSFYGAHWIPLFLNLPWNKALKKKYEGVKYDHF